MTDVEYALSLCNAGTPRHCRHPGALLRKLFRDRRLFLKDVARCSGISTTSLSSIMNEKQGLTDDVCGRLAYALDLPVEFWFLAQQRYRYQCYLSGLRERLAKGEAA